MSGSENQKVVVGVVAEETALDILEGPSPPSLHWRISVYILFRLMLASLFLIVAATRVIRDGTFGFESSNYFYLTAVVFFLMGLSAFGLRSVRSLQSFAYLQHVVDTVLVSVLISQTGGITSLFTALYFITIVASAYLVYRRGALIIAGLNSMAYIVVVSIQVASRVPSEVNLAGSMLYAEVLTRIFGFFLVAILAGQLAEKLRETGEALLDAEARSRALQEALNQVAQTISGGLAIIDRDGRMRSGNEAALHLFPDLMNAPVNEVIPKYEIDERLWEVQISRDGQRRQVILARSTLEDGGEVLSMEDVTRLRGMERVMQRDERQAAVGRLAAAIGHEIRNPLTSLFGAVQLLETPDGDDRLLRIITREVERINSLVSEFMAAARPRKMILALVEFDTLVTEVIETFRHDQRYQGLVEIEQQFQEMPSVEADQEQVRQVVWNLLLNAAQAMPGGGVIHVGLQHVGDRVRLMVSDGGIGIPSSDLEKVFDPFYSKRVGGTGLGLATVDRVAREHGGKVWVQSSEGKGTTFALWLPVQQEGPSVGEASV